MLSILEQANKLRELFSDKVSSSAFRKIDDEWMVVGKYGEITVLDSGKIDVFVRHPEREPLGTRRINIICNSLAAYTLPGRMAKLDGEAWMQFDELPDSAFKVLGVRRKMRYSDEQRKVMAERMKAIRYQKPVSR